MMIWINSMDRSFRVFLHLPGQLFVYELFLHLEVLDVSWIRKDGALGNLEALEEAIGLLCDLCLPL